MTLICLLSNSFKCVSGCNSILLEESKINADSDCSHKIKRYLFFGRIAMANLDSVLKSRDITLPTKVHIVKAVVSLVVLYGCESWMIKKAECQRIDAFFFFIYFHQLEANHFTTLQCVLSYFDMNQPWSYMYSPS